jgi:hypothetical protein
MKRTGHETSLSIFMYAPPCCGHCNSWGYGGIGAPHAYTPVQLSLNYALDDIL